METIKNLLKGFIPPIEPHRIVNFVVSANKLAPIHLDSPTQAKYITCPDCGSKNGFYNPPWKAWSCSEDICLEKWTRKKGKDTVTKYKLAIQGIPIDLESANLTSLDQPSNFKEEWIKWAKNPIGCLIFAGPAGLGKSFAAAGILKSVCEDSKKTGRFLNISDLYLEWKCKVKEGQDIDLIFKIVEYDILIFDDLGQRTPTDSFLEFLYILISKRNDLSKPSIVTTNMTYEKMREKLGEAITSRFTSGKPYKFTGTDRRKKPEW